MDWLKIGSAVFLGMMIIFIWPRMKHMVKNSPKGSTSDWMGVLLPIGGVILFVILLIASVR